MRFIRRSLVGLFLVCLTVSLLALGGRMIYTSLEARWARESFSRPANERIFSVNVTAVVPTTITPLLTSFGEVVSRRTLDIRAPVAGRIVELAPEFEEGGRVTADSLLARIDPADAQTAVDVAQTDLTEARADQREAERSLDLARDELTAAQDQAALQDRALARQKDLLARGVGTEAAVETAELAASSARQSVLSRRQAVQQAEAGIDQATTLIARRDINLANAKRLLADTEIHAAFDGRLSEVTVSAGGLMANNERLALLVDPTALEVAFRVSTLQYTRLLDAEGNLLETPVEIRLDVLGTDLVHKGRLIRESAAVQEGTTGRLLFASIEEPRGLRPGDFVTITATEPQLARVALIPAAAVGPDGTVLLLGPEDRLESGNVDVLRRQGDDVIIRAGPLAGREIVAQRSQLLGSGIKVRPLREVGETAPEAPEMLTLDAERRERLIKFVEANRVIPAEIRQRMLGRLAQDEVPARMVARIESRMGS